MSTRGKVIAQPRRAGALLWLAALGIGLLSPTPLPARGAGAPAAPTWRLVWRQEFNGRVGLPVDGTKWTAEVGGDGWGNQEYEYYTDSARNAHLDGRGNLAIMARKETPPNSTCWYGTCRYTSARLVTKGAFEQRYGRFETRLRVPAGYGYWPAFWMLGNDIDSVGWPACGEIDIMENVGQEPTIVHGSAHGPSYSAGDSLTDQYELSGGRRFADGFHLFAVEWSPTALRWYVDNHLYETRTPADLPTGTTWVYNHPFFLILNLAVGGQWPGDPAASTRFPQSLLVDYVRVYQPALPGQRP